MALEGPLKTLAVISSFAMIATAAAADVAEGQSEVVAAPTAPPGPPPSSWKVNVGISLIYLRSTAHTLTFAGQGSVERRIPGGRSVWNESIAWR